MRHVRLDCRASTRRGRRIRKEAPEQSANFREQANDVIIRLGGDAREGDGGTWLCSGVISCVLLGFRCVFDLCSNVCSSV
jgi:hypothetical protein